VREDSGHEIFKWLVSVLFFPAGPAPLTKSSFSELNLSAFFLDRFPTQG